MNEPKVANQIERLTTLASRGLNLAMEGPDYHYVDIFQELQGEIERTRIAMNIQTSELSATLLETMSERATYQARAERLQHDIEVLRGPHNVSQR